jgi:deoxyribodipyrimidine photolyase-related protein
MANAERAETLRFVLGDQLSRGLSSLQDLDPDRDVVLLAEVTAEATYVRHHPKKIAFIFAAMRHFAEALRAEGVRVDYVRLDDPDNAGDFTGELARAVQRHDASRVVVTEPGEWRVLEAMQTWRQATGVPVEIRDDDRFFCTRQRFADWAKGRKTLRMEHFYREMRRGTGVLMESDGQPAGGQWNYDVENRKPIPADLETPERHRVPPDAVTREVLDLVGQRFAHHFGTLDGFDFAVTAHQAEAAFEAFVRDALPCFGDYQDAMRVGEPTLFHARIGQYLNAGLLDPYAVCARAERAWRDGHAPLNAVEGFVRQILGWREYIRGLYWLKMPDYAETNALEAQRPLPELYWTGETDMRCLHEVVTQTRDEAYAHHIQRLMVTGTFALLAGLDPKAVNYWYLVVYADAYEWVELPNVQGMSLYADGGVLGSKPYAASGKYIDRMSDYCRHCRYDVKKQTGEDACPFNALYWDFIARNRDRLEGNPRMTMPYATLRKMKPEKLQALRTRAQSFLDSLDYAEPGAW